MVVVLTFVCFRLRVNLTIASLLYLTVVVLLSVTDALVTMGLMARDAVAIASAARTVAEISGGRFVLGIGVNHRPIVRDRGHSYDKPYSYMADYLPRLKQALNKAPSSTGPIPLLTAALHPRMLSLAATETDGTHPYLVPHLVPPEHTAKAHAQMGAKPWNCVEQAVILESDPVKARTVVRNHMSFYVSNLPNCRNNLKALGWQDADFADGCSDRLVDAIVAWGSEAQIRERLAAHLKTGATHVCSQTLRLDGKLLPDLHAIEVLAPHK